MKTEKEIKEKLKKFDAIETFPYNQAPAPMSEWIMHEDIGWRKALQWVLSDEFNT